MGENQVLLAVLATVTAIIGAITGMKIGDWYFHRHNRKDRS